MGAQLKTSFTGDTTGFDDALKKVNRGLADTSVKARSAGATVLNFSRVVQDAPFAFNNFGSIANNIDPLVESFGRLKNEARELSLETGKNVSVMSLLGKSLVGGAGVGLAISAVTSLITAFSMGLFDTAKNTDKAAEEQNKYKKVLEESAEVVKKAQADSLQQVQTVRMLATEILNTNAPYQERKRALEELKQTNKAYFGDLTLENSSYTKLTNTINQYASALINANIQKKVADKVSDAIFNEKDFAAQFDDITAKINKEVDRINKTIQNKVNIGIIDNDPEVRKKEFEYLRGESKVLSELVPKRREIADKWGEASIILGKLTEQYESATAATLRFQSTDDRSVKEVKTPKAFDTNEFYKKNLVDFNEGLYKLDQEFQKQFDESGKKAGEAFTDGLSGFMSGTSVRTKRVEEASKKLVELAALGFKVPDAATFFADPNNSAATLDILFPPDLVNQAKKRAEIITNAVQDAFINVADSFGSALGSGGSIGQAIAAGAESLLRIVGSVLQQVGTQMVTAALLAKALQKAIPKILLNPGLSLAVGVGLVALGGLLKNIKMTKVPGFADGITGFGGGMALVGERGPELVRLPSGSDVIPNHMIGGSQSLFVSGRIRGRDIFLVNDTESSRHNRLF